MSARLLAHEVCGFKNRVAFRCLHSRRVGNKSYAIRSGVGLVAYLCQQIRSARGKIDAFVSAFAADGDALYGFGDIFAHGLDHLFDLARRSRSALAQFFDLVGDYAKAAPLRAGLRSQYRRVQREQMRAVGNLVDDVRDFANLLGAFSKSSDGLGRSVNRLL